MVHGVIGVGAIAAAIVTGLCEGVEDAPTILLSPRNPEVATDLARRFRTVRVCPDNQAVIDGAEAVILCLRPQQAEAVLGQLTFRADQAIVSAMAGVSIAALEALVAPARDISRVIPLPSVARRQGLTAVFPATDATLSMFDFLGGTVVPKDIASFESLSAATATIAAHFTTLGRIARWLNARGLPQAEAERYVSSIYAELAPALQGGDTLEHLARDHATPGGINALFLQTMATAGAFDAVDRGLDGVMDRLTPAVGEQIG